MGLAAIVLFLAAALTAIGVDEDETSTVNDLVFFALFIVLGIGIPIAAGIAVLRYWLWGLDLVLKKTIVAALLLFLLAIASVVGLAVVGGIVVGPFSDAPEAALLVGVSVGALAWPLLRLSRRVADRIVYGRRATPYEVLTEFSGRLAETYANEDVLSRTAAILGERTGAERITISLLVGGELRVAATWPTAAGDEGPRIVTELAAADPGAFEVRHQGELLGAITARMPANDPMNPAKERLIRDLASQAGLVLRNVRLIEELRESRRRIVASQDVRAKKLERDIHDGAQQQLVALAVKLRLADAMVERDPAKAHHLLDQLQAETNEALEDLRDLARGIYPPLLADKRLPAALEAQARKSPVEVELAPNGVGRYDQEVEAAVYFCCLEALQNVAKYAGARRVRVALEHADGRLSFEVRDDGVGFDPAHVSRGLGVQGMADRVEAIGGTLEVRSARGRGTTISGSVPVD